MKNSKLIDILMIPIALIKLSFGMNIWFIPITTTVIIDENNSHNTL